MRWRADVMLLYFFEFVLSVLSVCFLCCSRYERHVPMLSYFLRVARYFTLFWIRVRGLQSIYITRMKLTESKYRYETNTNQTTCSSKGCGSSMVRRNPCIPIFLHSYIRKNRIKTNAVSSFDVLFRVRCLVCTSSGI